MNGISSICVYCGSSDGHSQELRDQVADFGRILAENEIRLVYGGGKVGLMGIVADAVLATGGAVTGIIPYFLDDRERGHKGVTELIKTDNMHARKHVMFERSDAFVALPGGIGTLDEMFEVISWHQLGLHDKPIVFANLDGYWQPLQDMIASIVGAGFASQPRGVLYEFADTVDTILPTIARHRESAVRARADRL
ncbi:MAG: TIGR00730 family Rossman fold protein [Alphaproteobacteria bacterium]|nr:TIGR00730 family Rossman fold protein [Alphaproteobacteria bacterium]